MKPRARLENWSLKHAPAWGAEEGIVYIAVIEGEVYGHPEHENGKRVQTSKIMEGTLNPDYTQVETMNTVYELGKPEQKFVDFLIEGGWPSGQKLKARLG